MKSTRIIIGLVVLIGCLVILGSALAADDYLIERSVISGGGQEASGGDFILHGTIGEPIANTFSLGATHGLSSGFWWVREFWLYLPIILIN